MLSKFARTKWRWGVLVLALVLAAAVFGTMALTHSDRAQADLQPPGCTGGGIQQLFNRTPAVAHVGDTITYDIGIFSGPSPNCLITDIATNFRRPGVPPPGEAIPVPTSLNPGASSAIFTRTYVIQQGDVSGAGTVTATLASTGLLHDNPIQNDPTSDTDQLTTNVVTPAITVEKTADPTLSKAGDSVDYTITVCNTGDVDLTKTSVTDTLIPGVDAAFGFSLAVAACETESFTRTVQPGDPDPLVNTVTAIYHDLIGGAQGTVTDSDDASVDLVHPAIDVTKTADPTTSKAGDSVDYTIEVCNTGDIGLEHITVSDSLLGDLSGSYADTLAPGACESHVFPRTVLATDPDPLVNVVTVNSDPLGPLTNPIPDRAEATVDLVHPAIDVTKTADPTTSKAGDSVDYTIEVCNTGDIGLEHITVSDSLLGDLSGSYADTLAAGACEEHVFPRTVLATDPDPLVNVVTVNADPLGPLTNPISDRAEARVDLVHPDFTIVKACSPDPVPVGGTITWEVTLANTGDVALIIVVSDPTAGISETVTLAAGATQTITRSRTVTSADVPAISNTVTATATLDPALGLDNVIGPKTASDSCAVPPPGEGCTPGYWKQPQHFDSWTAPYDPTDLFSAHFENAFPGMTLLQVLSQGGGGLNALGRHTVSALLNAASADVSYAFSPAEVIAAFNAVYPGGDYEALKNQFAAENERGCPLN